MGKGDTYRPVDKKRYDRNYLRLYGGPCPDCKTYGTVGVPDDHGCMKGERCSTCGGLGYVEKKHAIT